MYEKEYTNFDKELSLYSAKILDCGILIEYNGQRVVNEEDVSMENRRVSMNRHTNLLQLEEHMYPLVDVATPNVFRNLFPYSEVPKIAFNDRVVPHHMPDDIWITDTTFRDGQQSRAPYSTEQIVRIYDYLHKLGGPEGRIRASVIFPLQQEGQRCC